jgi:hypothetical protein
MSYLLKYVWTVKVCLTGWSAYKACIGENSFICFMSSSYFCILCIATICSWRSFTKAKQIDSLEGEYLRRLEEGILDQTNVKQS